VPLDLLIIRPAFANLVRIFAITVACARVLVFELVRGPWTVPQPAFCKKHHAINAASNHRDQSVPLFHDVLFGVHVFIMLREAVSDREPRCLVLDKNVSARADFRIINERA
jgi:hypothetical protein